jgi:hypothetical protein
MTTIAWDGKTLAGDRKRNVRNTPVPATKVFRLPEPVTVGNLPRVAMFGCAGDSSEAVAVADWLLRNAEKPMAKDIDILAVDAYGKCHFAANNLVFYPIELQHWAVGSGADYAMGAMARGASAHEAVQVASLYDNGTGLGVDVLAL